MRNRRLFAAPIVLASLAVAAGCSSVAGDAPTATRTAGVAVNHVVTMYPDGRFAPASLAIQEGDSVTFRGPIGIAGIIPLRTTDAVVEVNQADLGAGVACMTSTRAYGIDHMLPGDDNEMTGPLRRGPSGIYARGPERNEGHFEGPVADSCATIMAAAGSPLGAAEVAVETTVPGAATKLCHKEVNGKKSKTTNSPHLLQSLWDDPDIAGAHIQINWDELFTMTLVGNVETYTLSFAKLDHELEEAAKRGKIAFVSIMAGDGIPKWIFTDYAAQVDATATGIAPKSVIPIYTRDYGSSDSGDWPKPNDCGYEKTMGSPADDDYKNAFLTTLRSVAQRIRGNTRHYQALGALKVTGLNFLTGETRLPKRCLDPAVPNADNGNSQATCYCNTRIWATTLGNALPAYDGDPNAPLVTGGGYTAQIAQNFLNAVENTIYVELGKRKSMHYMLIQDGFPKVFDSAHFAMDSDTSLNNGYVDLAGNPIDFDQQTKDALDGAQAGNFRKINPDGSPNLAAGLDPDGPALFTPMHNGLGPIPDASGGTPCQQALTTAIVSGKLQGVVAEPGVMSTNLNQYSGSSSGCPNKWATREGYEGQIGGYQTTNDLGSPSSGHTAGDDLSATLWNATLNSNAVFVEVYGDVLWKVRQDKLLGATVLSTSAAGFADVPERQKSLSQWAAELHARRRTIAGFAANANNRHMKDPFPASYTFTFKKNLALNAVESHFFINPAARCASNTLHSGRIDVTGN
jgi:hypothetical protein